MKKIIRTVRKHYSERNAEDHKLQNYWSLREHPGWEIHREILLTIRTAIAQEMLSEEFTNMTSREKDIRQRAFNYTNEILSFLLNPLEKAMKREVFMRELDKKLGIRR